MAIYGLYKLFIFRATLASGFQKLAAVPATGITPGKPIAPVIMIGEKAVDLVKQQEQRTRNR